MVAVLEALALVHLELPDDGFVELFFGLLALFITIARGDGRLEASVLCAHAYLKELDAGRHTLVFCGVQSGHGTSERVIGPGTLGARGRQSEEGRAGDTQKAY